MKDIDLGSEQGSLRSCHLSRDLDEEKVPGMQAFQSGIVSYSRE